MRENKINIASQLLNESLVDVLYERQQRRDLQESSRSLNQSYTHVKCLDKSISLMGLVKSGAFKINKKLTKSKHSLAQPLPKIWEP